MKKTSFMTTYDEDKLVALKMYLEQKGSGLDEEIQSCLENLYSKYVPVPVREFISMRAGVAPEEKKKKSKPAGREPIAKALTQPGNDEK